MLCIVSRLCALDINSTRAFNLGVVDAIASVLPQIPSLLETNEELGENPHVILRPTTVQQIDMSGILGMDEDTVIADQKRLERMPPSMWTLIAILCRLSAARAEFCQKLMLKAACERYLLVTSKPVIDLQAKGEIALIFAKNTYDVFQDS